MKHRIQEYERWMREALHEAEKAFREGEVPVGAVVVYKNRIIGRGHNRTEALKDATAHAEILAITAASTTVSDWRLEDADLYVTLEPCLMCAGAILNARIRRVVYGAMDPQAGACGSVLNVVQDPRFRHHVDLVPGILEDAAERLLKAFFALRRNRRSEVSF